MNTTTLHENISRNAHACGVALAGALLLASGCLAGADPGEGPEAFEDETDGEGTTDEPLDDGSSESEATTALGGDASPAAGSLASAPDSTATLYCSQNNDCSSGCLCYDGYCQPDGFGPPNPYCDEPPERACVGDSNCQSGCDCIGGICQPDGFGPINTNCHMPPADTYENDDVWQSWKPYTGTPQSHNFDQALDNDWVAVYFGVAGSARFRTYNLTLGTDTRIEVYAYVNGGKGPLVASNDNIGGAWWLPDSKSSRVDLPVAAGSGYYVRVVDKSPASFYTDSHVFPSYMLEIAYN